VDVAVRDVGAAISFYRAALGGVPLGADVSGAERVDLGGALLRVLDEATQAPNASDLRYYVKGRVPRLELRVDDVAARVEQALLAGAVLRASIPGRDEEGDMSYAQIIDPFGHMWSFRRAS
jgi:uncharacterized glyoxalase superfamily protein PhnB